MISRGFLFVATGLEFHTCFFVDDSVLFYRAKETECQKILGDFRGL